MLDQKKIDRITKTLTLAAHAGTGDNEALASLGRFREMLGTETIEDLITGLTPPRPAAAPAGVIVVMQIEIDRLKGQIEFWQGQVRKTQSEAKKAEASAAEQKRLRLDAERMLRNLRQKTKDLRNEAKGTPKAAAKPEPVAQNTVANRVRAEKAQAFVQKHGAEVLRLRALDWSLQTIATHMDKKHVGPSGGHWNRMTVKRIVDALS